MPEGRGPVTRSEKENEGAGEGDRAPLAAEDLLCCPGSKDALSSPPLPQSVTAVAAAPPARAARRAPGHPCHY